MNDEIVVLAKIKQDIWKPPAVGLDHKDIWNYPGLCPFLIASSVFFKIYIVKWAFRKITEIKI
jgi:hypothetical protein